MPLKVGVVGCSIHHSVPNRVKTFMDAGAEVTALADIDEERLTAAAAAVKALNGDAAPYPDAANLFEHDDLDIVVLAVPNGLHAALASEAMITGRHVFVDKPAAITCDEVRGMVSVAIRTRRILHVGYQKRYALAAAQQAIRDGVIGKILEVSSRWSRPKGGLADLPRPLREDRVSGGAGLDLGSHLVDASLELLGASPSYVIAESWGDNGIREVGADSFAVDDRVRAWIGFDDGKLLTVAVDWADDIASEVTSIEVRGVDGRLVIPLHGPQETLDGLETVIWNGPTRRVLAPAIHNNVMNVEAARHFISACLGETEPQPLEGLVTTQAVLDAIRRSAGNKGRRVDLAELI